MTISTWLISAWLVSIGYGLCWLAFVCAFALAIGVIIKVMRGGQ